MGKKPPSLKAEHKLDDYMRAKGILLRWLFGFLAYGDQASFDGGDDCLGAGVSIQFA